MKKKIIVDMLLNIIAAAVPVAILQLLVYPLSADKLGGDEYGFMITIYSVWIMVSNSIGNVLNNVRLLHNNNYADAKIAGDFLILFKRWNIVNAIIVCVVITYYSVHNNSFSIMHICLGTIVACLVLTKAYLEVGFRIKLNYKAIVVNNILQSIGFLLGCMISNTTGIWEFIFLVGYAFSCIFCMCRTSLLKEEKIKTEFYSKVNRDFNHLAIATIISNLMNYADKLVLYPLMGGYAVSVYYTATILGKMIGMLTGPINSVILSYISRWNSDKKNILNKVLIIGVVITVAGYCITMLLGRTVIGLLFPQWVDEVMIYLPVTTITVSLLTLISIISPFVLKFCDMKWQIVINSSSVLVYFVGALLLWKKFGLMGFCVGTVIGTMVKLIIMIIVYYRSNKPFLEDKNI